MIEKCANPACDARFKYLHEGRLFAIEGIDGSNASGLARSADCIGRSASLQHFWLCDACCKSMVITADPQNRVKVMPVAGPNILQAD